MDDAAGTTMAHRASSESGTQVAGFSDVIFVVPPVGAPPETGLVLADAIAAELRDANHPAILAFEPNQAGASIVGQVQSGDLNGSVLWLTVDWSVRAPYGTLVATYKQRVVVDRDLWEEGGAEAINLLVGDAAPEIVKLAGTHVGPADQFAMRRPIPKEDPPPSPTMALAPPEPASQTAEAAPPIETTAEVRAREARPVQPPPSQPLARIANDTNGQVVSVMPDPVPSAVSEAQPAGASDRPPLPSLLDLPPLDPAASSAPPTPLVPGAAREIAPPPGGTTEPAPTEEEESLADRLLPNMDVTERRVGDARPPSVSDVSFAQVRWGNPSFLIRPVSGAPGNGNQALTAGLKSALRARDLTISEDPRQASFVIDGDVDLGPPASGRQYVKITWNVRTVAGDEVGKAVQENTVIAGSLDGEWGQVAEVVSNAAVRGIQDLFGSERQRPVDGNVLPNFPEIDLPDIPGRAPPPPTGY